MTFNVIPSKEIIEKTIENLKSRGFQAEFLETKERALARIKEIIPPGAEIMTGSSRTLEEIGFIDLLKSKNHPWENWKDKILAEKDAAKQRKLRQESSLSEYFLNSVNAISQNGELVIASATGSQIPSCAYLSKKVILVVGAQKIVPNLEEGLKRVRDYALPLEDKRIKDAGGKGSFIGKYLILEREYSPDRIILLLIDEVLGF